MQNIVLHVYDLSGGMARQLSMAFLGQQIDGIWHTGIVAFGREWYFGGGIFSDAPSNTPYGTPVRSVDLGRTTKTQAEFFAWLRQMSGSKYHLRSYDLLSNNCNSFTDDAAMFLVGTHIPDDIRHLPAQFLSTPLGRAIAPMLSAQTQQMQQYAQQHHGQVFLDGPAASPSPSAATPEKAPAPPAATADELLGRPVFFECSPDKLPKIIERAESEAREHLNPRQRAVLHNLKSFFAGKTVLDWCADEVNLLTDLSRRLKHQSFAVLDLLRVVCSRASKASYRRLDAGFVAELAGQLSDLPAGSRLMALRLFANLVGNSLLHEDAKVDVFAPLIDEELQEAAATLLATAPEAPNGTAAAAAAFLFNGHQLAKRCGQKIDPTVLVCSLVEIVDSPQLAKADLLNCFRALALLTRDHPDTRSLIHELHPTPFTTNDSDIQTLINVIK